MYQDVDDDDDDDDDGSEGLIPFGSFTLLMIVISVFSLILILKRKNDISKI
ncbi:MAG: hypothetical protein ACFFAN_11595 [Promethearchaeota archaeon]